MKRVLLVVALLAAVGYGCAPVATKTPERAQACEACPSSFPREMVDAVNADRKANGVRPVEIASDLNRMAQAWAEELARSGVLRHSPESHRVYERERGESTIVLHALENVLGPSIGCLDAAQLEALWVLSPPHRVNILHTGWGTFGAGVAVDAQGRLWAVQEFGAA